MNTCLNCGNTFEGKYCNSCGEKIFLPEQNTFRYVAEETFHFFTHFDSKYLHTLKTMLIRPGLYTLEYCKGIKVRYYKPVPFLILSVIIYLINPYKYDGLNSSLNNQLTVTGYSNLKEKIKEETMWNKYLDEREYAAYYKEHSFLVSKIFIFLFLPVFCFFIALCGLVRRSAKTFFENFIAGVELLSLNIWAGYMLSMFAVLPFAIAFGDNNTVVQFLGEIPFLIYSTLFFKRYLNTKTVFAFVMAFAFSAIIFFINPVFRLGVFYVTNMLI